MIDRTGEVYTSSSVMLLKEHIEQERRKMVVLPLNPFMSYEERMAIKIQRAWRKYKTNCLIRTIFAISKPSEKDIKIEDSSAI